MVKAWNEEGFDGLLRKEGSGRKTKLSEKQFEELKEIIIKNQLTSVREIKNNDENNLVLFIVIGKLEG